MDIVFSSNCTLEKAAKNLSVRLPILWLELLRVVVPLFSHRLVADNNPKIYTFFNACEPGICLVPSLVVIMYHSKYNT